MKLKKLTFQSYRRKSIPTNRIKITINAKNTSTNITDFPAVVLWSFGTANPSKHCAAYP